MIIPKTERFIGVSSVPARDKKAWKYMKLQMV